ncbi:FAD/NAD(P)-binding domain-containing protein [Amniculicola lignicola CBS 123094]|uniref:FAD/NAD(P)-binding domain-containing protein n=1 Tax=Amniculicola lignicola CBS 123094 TaxID=1392246 RepID=A0A6A5WXK7_9PLEO|nr:FAD/NAD(P)-binding domain-containing protein [Amniculicola lignicola CBS 123094]
MTSETPVRIAIVGAGMGGLASALALAKAGHKDITVYENAPGLGFVGAGIQLAPNMARILDRLGCWKQIAAEAVQCANTSIRDGATNKELGYVALDYVKETYGYPHMVGHRASLAGAMYDGCLKEKSITFKLGSTVSDVTFSPKPAFKVTLATGDEPYRVECDILLGCDGIKSNTRVAMLKELGETVGVENTGQAAYRILLTRDQMKDDPELLALIDSDTVTRWIGAKRHIIAYSIDSKNIYNISTAQPDNNFAMAPSATYTTTGSKSEMMKVYDDFCPMIHRMLNLVPEGEVCEWKLRVHEPLSTWVHGATALVGDACHPTLPHLAQGAAQAIEDAAVLGVTLAPSRISSSDPSSINNALKIYESVRKDRAEALVNLAAENGRSMHLGAGSAKEERDKMFAALKTGKGPVPDKWADADVQRMIYGHDCVEEAEKACKEQGIRAKLST